MASQNLTYNPCKDIKRKPMEILEDKDSISSKFRVLPLYEKSVYEDSHRKHYSLKTNEFLKCRWLQYKENYATHVVTPLHFPNNRDEHFYNNYARLIPSQSLHLKSDFRYKLSPDPGVDALGNQRPIPYEALKGLRN